MLEHKASPEEKNVYHFQQKYNIVLYMGLLLTKSHLHKIKFPICFSHTVLPLLLSQFLSVPCGQYILIQNMANTVSFKAQLW